MNSTKYKHKRDNFLYSLFKDMPNVGRYSMPVIKATHNTKILNLLPYNYLHSCELPSEYYLCFYIDDYQFERIWNEPLRSLDALKKFKGIIGPDFSLYRDLPTILNIYNCWRNKVLMAFYQSKGIEVIPNVSWSDEASFKWCFDGLPMHSVVAVSTNGCMRDKTAKQLFLNGYKEMLRRLEPEKVIIVGHLPKELEDSKNIIHFEGYSSMFATVEKQMKYQGGV